MALPKWPRHTEWSREKKTIESSETEEERERRQTVSAWSTSPPLEGRGKGRGGSIPSILPLSVRSLCSLGRIYKDLGDGGGKDFHSVRQTDESDGK